MRTTIDVDRDLLRDVIRVTGESTTSKAVSAALEDYLYRKALERLEELSGTVEIDDWEESEQLELDEVDDVRAKLTRDRR